MHSCCTNEEANKIVVDESPVSNKTFLILLTERFTKTSFRAQMMSIVSRDYLKNIKQNKSKEEQKGDQQVHTI